MDIKRVVLDCPFCGADGPWGVLAITSWTTLTCRHGYAYRALAVPDDEAEDRPPQPEVP
jgi:hypothetical protein